MRSHNKLSFAIRDRTMCLLSSIVNQIKVIFSEPKIPFKKRRGGSAGCSPTHVLSPLHTTQQKTFFTFCPLFFKHFLQSPFHHTSSFTTRAASKTGKGGPTFFYGRWLRASSFLDSGEKKFGRKKKFGVQNLTGSEGEFPTNF